MIKGYNVVLNVIGSAIPNTNENIVAKGLNDDSTTEYSISQIATVEAISTEATTVGLEVRVYLDFFAVVIGGGNAYSIDVSPYIQLSTNSIMVPLRFVSVALLGGNVISADISLAINWAANTKTASIDYGDNVIGFQAESNIINASGVENTMANNVVVSEISNGRLYILFRALSEAFGADVDWDSVSNRLFTEHNLKLKLCTFVT